MQEQSTELVDIEAACRILGGEETPIGTATLWRGIKSGRFPAPLKIAPQVRRWKRSELLETLRKFEVARDGEAAA